MLGATLPVPDEHAQIWCEVSKFEVLEGRPGRSLLQESGAIPDTQFFMMNLPARNLNSNIARIRDSWFMLIQLPGCFVWTYSTLKFTCLSWFTQFTPLKLCCRKTGLTILGHNQLSIFPVIILIYPINIPLYPHCSWSNSHSSFFDPNFIRWLFGKGYPFQDIT